LQHRGDLSIGGEFFWNPLPGAGEGFFINPVSQNPGNFFHWKGTGDERGFGVSVKFLQLLYLFQEYGYFIIFAGTFFEGETTLVLGGLLSHQGHLNFWIVIVTAAFASYLGHVVFYFLGKTASPWIFSRFPKFQLKILQAEGLIRRHETTSLFITQYVFGLRLASALAFGILDMKIIKFLSLQLTSCIIWAILFATLGYCVGDSYGRTIKNIEWVILFTLIIGFLIALIGRKIFDYWLRSR
jgi:membrane protein DedA with SNARE-associated domain